MAAELVNYQGQNIEKLLVATKESPGLLSDEDKAKLEVLSAFNKIIVEGTEIETDDVVDNIAFEAGTNITLTANPENNKITIAAKDTTYSAAGTSLGLVKSGGDVTISSGTITVNDDSHNHTISNVDGLQTALDNVKKYTDEQIANITSGDGTVSTADFAISASKDANGNVIASTYIKDLSVSGTTITYKKGDNTTGTITTQDTTYSAATQTSSGLMSAADKKKVDAIPANPKYTDTVYTHPSYTAKSSGLYKVAVDATGHVSATTAVTKNDILSLGISGNDTTYDVATQTTDGLMSSTDKKKVDAIPSDAKYTDTVYTHPTYTAKASGLYKVTVDSTGHVSSTTAVTKNDILSLGISGDDTTYDVATYTSNGLMSSTDKVNLDDIVKCVLNIDYENKLKFDTTEIV